jgi:hypothetical protein
MWQLNSDIDITPNQLEAEMERVHDKYGIHPVIIFEFIGSGIVGDQIVMNNARIVAKRLSHLCNVLLIMSESQALIHFGQDPTREQFIFVGELSVHEATTYLKKHFPEMAAEEMKIKVFDQIGTYPLRLHHLINRLQKGIPIETIVHDALDDAATDLELFPLQTILKALKDLPNPDDGVHPLSFKCQQENGINLTDVAEVARVMEMGLVHEGRASRNSPILYRKDTKKYHLVSTAHKTALKTYVPRLSQGRGVFS